MRQILIRGVLVRGCDKGCPVQWPCPVHDAGTQEQIGEAVREAYAERPKLRTEPAPEPLPRKPERGTVLPVPVSKWDAIMGIEETAIPAGATVRIDVVPNVEIFLNVLVLHTDRERDERWLKLQSLYANCINHNVSSAPIPFEVFKNGYEFARPELLRPGLGAQLHIVNGGQSAVIIGGAVMGNRPRREPSKLDYILDDLMNNGERN